MTPLGDGRTPETTGNLEWYDANVKTPRVLELEARIEALERRRHGLVIEIEVYRHALAGIRDGSSIPKTIAYRALHAGENAALRLFTLARNEAALRSEEET